MPYGDFKVLPRRTVADKVFEKAFKIQNMMGINVDFAKNPKYDGYQC